MLTKVSLDVFGKIGVTKGGPVIGAEGLDPFV